MGVMYGPQMPWIAKVHSKSKIEAFAVSHDIPGPEGVILQTVKHVLICII